LTSGGAALEGEAEYTNIFAGGYFMSILDQFKLDGKGALITGAAQGIGEGYATALGEAGAKVAIVDINGAKAEATADRLCKAGITAIALKCDVTNEDEVHKMVAQVVDKFGNLTIGVNDAGIGQWADALTQPYNEWRKVTRLNYDGVWLCCQAEGQVMAKAGYGKIINQGSMSAWIVNTPQNQNAYNSSKAAVIHLTRSLAAEWAPIGIRVNSISPGYTKTALVDDLLKTGDGQKMMKEWMHRTPMGKMVQVDDLKGACVYLASPASDMTTGADIVVDGGYCVW
jgi:NAD(P)-dependent dehydrogenase (short-subunit alcohol dehydrogenase family)